MTGLQWIRAHVGYAGDDCLTWPRARNGKGYGILFVGKRRFLNGHPKQMAHRIMCVLAHGEPLIAGMMTRHLCGYGHLGCVNPRHLAWGTRAENIADMHRHGRTYPGEKHWFAKLTDGDVDAIRKHYAEYRLTVKEIGNMFGISGSQVSSISSGRMWSHRTETIVKSRRAKAIRPRATPTKRVAIEELVRARVPVKQIAKHVGVQVEYVRSVARQIGLPAGRMKAKAKTVDVVRRQPSLPQFKCMEGLA